MSSGNAAEVAVPVRARRRWLLPVAVFTLVLAAQLLPGGAHRHGHSVPGRVGRGRAADVSRLAGWDVARVEPLARAQRAPDFLDPLARPRALFRQRAVGPARRAGGQCAGARGGGRGAGGDIGRRVRSRWSGVGGGGPGVHFPAARRLAERAVGISVAGLLRAAVFAAGAGVAGSGHALTAAVGRRAGGGSGGALCDGIGGVSAGGAARAGAGARRSAGGSTARSGKSRRPRWRCSHSRWFSEWMCPEMRRYTRTRRGSFSMRWVGRSRGPTPRCPRLRSCSTCRC